MKIAGFVKNSLIDYPGKITSIVFTQGCNFRCPFCHNPDLIPLKGREYIREEEVFEYLKKRKGLVEAVTITGGEPLIQKDLFDFIGRLKRLGVLIKVDTNGSNPALLRKLIEKAQVDYLAMDIKSSPSKYQEITGLDTIEKIRESIAIITQSGLDYEFRTTVLPRLHQLDDFKEIGQMIKTSNTYFIQNFRPQNTLDKAFLKEKSFTASELQAIKTIMDNYVLDCQIRENI